LTDNPGALVAAITAGLCLGFLPHNFNPARIFMGDAGALMLGLLMAVSTTMVGGRNEQAFSGAVVLLLRADLHSSRHPRRSAARCALRHRAPNSPQKRRRDRRQGPPSPSADAHRPRPPPQCAHPVGVDDIAFGFVLYPTYNYGRGDAMVPTGIAALGLLLYTVLHPDIRQGRAERP
jgi:UDP-GlcNAc:undecaprenyl-phosphate GlcNAc-1-phosphate transferase